MTPRRSPSRSTPVTSPTRRTRSSRSPGRWWRAWGRPAVRLRCPPGPGSSPSPRSKMQAITDERPPLRHLSSIHGGLVLAVLALASIGRFTVHSASSEMVTDYLPRQALWVGMGLVVMLVAMSFDYHVLLDFSIVLYGAGLAMLV